MADLNVITLSGNLTQDPELRHTPKGLSVCNARLANNGFGRDEETLFINIVLWGKDAEYCADNCSKGTFVEVSGRFSLRSYTDRNGNERTSPEVNVKSFHAKTRIASTSNDGGGYKSTYKGGAYSAPSETAESFNDSFDGGDGIPF